MTSNLRGTRITGLTAGLIAILFMVLGPAADTGDAAKRAYRLATPAERASLNAAHGPSSADRVKFIVLRKKPRYGAICENWRLAGTQANIYRRPHARSTDWTYVTGGSGIDPRYGRAARTLLSACFKVL